MYYQLFVARNFYWIHAILSRILSLLRRWWLRFRDESRAPVPEDVKVSPLWMEGLLKNKGLIKVNGKESQVAEVKIEELEENRGLRSAVSRIIVVFRASKDDQQTFPACSSFILKRAPVGIKQRYDIVTSDAWREAWFYNSSYAEKAKHIVPETLYAKGSSVFSELVLLSRDVSREAVPSYHVLESNRDKDVVSCLESVYISMAELHSRTWKDRSLLGNSWMKGAQWYTGRGRIKWELAMALARKCWARVKGSSFSDSVISKSVNLEPKLVNIIDRSFEESSWDSMQKHLQDPKVPFMLCHGDFHGANMLVRQQEVKEDPWKIFLIDWSEIGPWDGVTDLAQMIISNIRPQVFLKYGRMLLKKYWKRLIELGVDSNEYPFEMCWELYCRGGCEKWIWLFAVLAGSGAVPPSRVQHFHDQLWAFMKGHGKQEYYSLKSVFCIA